MKVAEERAPFAVPFSHAEQVGVECIGGFSCGTRAIDRVRCAIEDRPMLADEVFPRRFVSVCARCGESEVLKLESGGVAFGGCGRCAARKRMRDAGIENGTEAIGRDAPSPGVRVLVEPLDNGRVEHRLVLCPLGHRRV